MIHIFRKDVRRLWAPLAIALALQTLFTIFEIRPRGQSGLIANQITPETLVDFLLPLAWWYLIAALVHEEALPGDRQFWVTRPYYWKSLLAAKVLFILLFVNFPLLIGDCFILTAQGFSLGQLWQGVLWRQIPFSLWLLLPPLALGSLTRNLGQVVVAILLIVLRIVAASLPLESGSAIPEGSTPVAWVGATIDALVMLGVLAAVIFIQYRYRRSLPARALFAAFVIFPGVPIPMRWQLDWHARLRPPRVDTSAIRIGFDATRGRRMPLNRVPRVNLVTVAIPVAAIGVPKGLELVSTFGNLHIDGHTIAGRATIDRDQRGYWENITAPVNVYRSVENQPSTMRITAVLTVVRHSEFRVPVETGPMRVPAIGICESARQGMELLHIYCRWPLRSPQRTRIHADYPGWETAVPPGRPHEQVTGELSDSPFPADLGLSPVHTAEVFSLLGNELTRALASGGTELVFDTEHPMAHFQTEFDVPSDRLKDYAILEPE
jgi:hypothetical protein